MQCLLQATNLSIETCTWHLDHARTAEASGQTAETANRRDVLRQGTLGRACCGPWVNSLASTTMRSSVFFSELLHTLVFRPGLTQFSLSLSDATVAGGIPDSLSLFLLDTNLAPFATSDPAGALILIDLRPPLTPQVFSSAFASASVSVVPEPAWLVFLLAGLVVIGCRQKILNSSHR